ncbi:penicillin-binding protein activator [Marinivivus vitaminiproducens]|uniref:penicillin-binding protein activator n=1 Tax=Marinivivus vitaminiproducens TaxID=3035935 RepID=UPI0027A1C308|nr:penicillin-binding protein activator [Geminicoccaceae bacterium SCSIO 64248]
MLPSPVRLVLVLCLGLAGCGGGSTPPPWRADGIGGDFYGGPDGESGQEVRVGLLLPLSGDQRPVGEDALRAAEMAIFDRGDNDVVLLPRDSGASSSRAAEAARSLVADGAQLLIGPLYSEGVSAVADQRGTAPVLAFSNNASVARPGVWLLGFRPEEQVTRVVEYARSQGLSTFSGYGPGDAFGSLTLASLRASVARAGGRLQAIETYQAGSQPSASLVRPLTQPGRPDAVFIADGGVQARALAATVAYAGAEDEAPEANPPAEPGTSRFLGTQRWLADPELGSEPGLTGSWLAAPSPEALDAFVQRFEDAFGTRPADPIIASLAYDAAAMAAELSLSDQGYNDAALTDPLGFYGASGVFRLRPDGLTDHGLAVLEVTPSGPVQIEDAPSSLPVPEEAGLGALLPTQ